MADSSFDIVSKVDHQEVDNALNQAAKEIAQRYDFKNVGASIAAWSGGGRHEGQLRGRVQGSAGVFPGKLIKRGISLKAPRAGEPKASEGRSSKSPTSSRRASRPRRTPRSSASSSATKARRA